MSSCSPSLPLPRWSDRETSALSLWNNSAWIDSCPPVFKPNCDGDAPSFDHMRISTVDLIQHLIDFLNEFLPFLPTIIDDQVHYCATQRTNMMDLIEHLQQLRTDLMREITNCSEYPTSVIVFDISTVSVVLQQLSSLLWQFNRQEECLESNALSVHKSKLIQWSNDLEVLTASSMRIMQMGSNEVVRDSSPVVFKMSNKDFGATAVPVIPDPFTDDSCPGSLCNQSFVSVHWWSSWSLHSMAGFGSSEKSMRCELPVGIDVRHWRGSSPSKNEVRS